MQTYAKYINEHQIELAPKNKGAVSNYDHDIELMTADGYLPVVVVEEPTAERPIVKYREVSGQIEKYAEAVPISAIPEATEEQREIQVRMRRNSLLSQCDWTQLTDAPLTDEEKQVWAAYRQALRDIPEQADFPRNVTWPQIPVTEEANAIV